ncbi:MAG: universal stress protein [Dehalococcoidia bacterium]|nr:universal stress protein [Dehalococcoidia bacterium]
MFKKILVPLDGSVEAETVLPYVRDIATRFGSEVNILSVGMGSRRRRVNQLLDDYIQHAVEHLQGHSIICRAVVLYNDAAENESGYAEITARTKQIKAKGNLLYGGPADKILEYTRKHRINLVVMATHGLSGLRRWWLGSVFEKVISQSTVPVLGIHSKHAKEIDKDSVVTFKRILVPLDGSDTGEAALHDAESIALKTGASMVLLHVIPEPHMIEVRMLGSEFSDIVKAMHDAGEKYLAKVNKRLNEKGIDVTAKILSGDPAARIVDQARHEKADLLAISTHGRSGIARWVLGSVADKILHESKIPMWMVRPRKIIHEMAGTSNHKVN